MRELNDTQSLLGVIEGVYSTVLDPSRWSSVLDHVAWEVNAKGSVLVLRDNHYCETDLHAVSETLFDQETLGVYQKKYMQQDNLDDLFNSPPRAIISQADLFPSEEAYRNHPPIAWMRKEC